MPTLDNKNADFVLDLLAYNTARPFGKRSLSVGHPQNLNVHVCGVVAVFSNIHT